MLDIFSTLYSEVVTLEPARRHLAGSAHARKWASSESAPGRQVYFALHGALIRLEAAESGTWWHLFCFARSINTTMLCKFGWCKERNATVWVLVLWDRELGTLCSPVIFTPWVQRRCFVSLGCRGERNATVWVLVSWGGEVGLAGAVAGTHAHKYIRARTHAEYFSFQYTIRINSDRWNLKNILIIKIFIYRLI